MGSAGLSLGKRSFLKQSLWGASCHALIAWGALSLSYCAYKAYVRWLTSAFPAWLKLEIKSSFPSAIVIFASVYLIHYAKTQKRYAGERDYALMLSAYALCVNTLMFSYPAPVMLVLNGSVIITAFILALLSLVKRLPPYLMVIAEWLKIAPWLTRITSEARTAALSFSANTARIPSRLIAAGTGLIILCTIFMAAKQGTAAGHAASLAWFLLLSGVLLKLIRSLRDRGED